MPRTPGGVSPTQAAAVKQLLMEGKSQAHIAAVMGLSQASVSRVKSGALHGDVVWPKGGPGPMPLELAAGKAEKWSTRALAYQSFTEQMQLHILEVVNEGRRQANLDEIPKSDPAYMMYLENLDTLELEPDEQIVSMEQAVNAEDKRICALMDEFQWLIDQETHASREDELLSILASTRALPTAEDEGGTPLTRHTPLTYQTAPLEYTALTQAELLEMAGKVGIVAEAIATEIPSLELACRIVFYQLKGSDSKALRLPFVEKEVRKVAAKLKAQGA